MKFKLLKDTLFVQGLLDRESGTKGLRLPVVVLHYLGSWTPQDLIKTVGWGTHTHKMLHIISLASYNLPVDIMISTEVSAFNYY